MKCTNKCLALLTALAVCFGATGCSDEAIAFSYNPDYKVSAFRISGDTGFETADAFASGLCVVNGDINTDNSSVDMTDATSAGLFDLNSRTVLYAKNIHERLAPASLTKLMTAVVALKYGNPNDVITVSSNMGNLESGAVVCGLAEGDQLTLNQALHALLIKSANDAAVAIAEHIGGSVEGFADMMNEKAKEIGAATKMCFIPQNLDYLRAGGRVSNAVALVGNILSLHPCIEILDGKLIAKKKYRGALSKIVPNLIREYTEANRLQKDQLYFIWSQGLPEEIKRLAEKVAAELGFQNVTWMKTGCVISCHGGPGCFGIVGMSEE